MKLRSVSVLYVYCYGAIYFSTFYTHSGKVFGEVTMNLLFIILAVLACTCGEIPAPKNDIFQSSEFKNGTTVIFSSLVDKSVITVHKNGDVTTEKFSGSLEQRWTLVTHPNEPNALEFKNEIVPYNMLSGYKDSPENPGIFPRPLGLANRGPIDDLQTWNILIRGRWCLQANGVGYQMDYDDCEYFIAKWQLWELTVVA